MCDGRSQCIAYEFDDWWSDWQVAIYDFSDEENCENWTCPDEFWKCQESNICIQNIHLCDGKDDCVQIPLIDMSDEEGCESNLTCEEGSDIPKCQRKNCFQGFIYCNGTCVDQRLVCNGVNNFGDGRDELCCSHVICEEKDWKCDTGQACVPKTSLCNGIFNCMDKSDEKCKGILCCYFSF